MTIRTWLWIIGGFAFLCVLGLVALAGAGVYFVMQHIDTETTTSSGALREFDTARAPFQTATPLIEIDAMDRPHPTGALRALPTSPVRPEHLNVLAWEPGEDRLVRIRLPFWILRLGPQKIDFLKDARDIDFEELDLDFAELERIGPALVLDHRSPSGERVLIWTQ